MNNNYEIAREKMAILLNGSLSKSDMELVLSTFDAVMHPFDLTVKETGLVVYDGNATEQIVNFYTEAMFTKELSEKTLANRKITLMNFFTIVGKHPADVEHNDIYKYKYVMMKKGVEGNTINTYLSGISAFYKWAINRGIAKVNPVTDEDKSKVKDQEHLPLNEFQIKKIRMVINEMECSKRIRAMFELMLSSGMRREEVCKAKIEDIRYDMKTDDGIVPIHVPVGKGGKERYTFISPYAMEYIQAYLDGRTDKSQYLFPSRNGQGQLSPCRVNDIFKKISKASEIEFTPHTLRRTFATESVHNGSSINAVSRMMGHANISTTMIYAKDTIETLAEAFAASHVG